jgi:hypothetical protein
MLLQISVNFTPLADHVQRGRSSKVQSMEDNLLMSTRGAAT